MLASIGLVAGWNLISLPVVPLTSAVGNVLAGLIASNGLAIVWSFQGGSWKFFTPTGSPTLTTMVDGLGYWLYVTHAYTLLVLGFTVVPGATPPVYALTAGWNLVGFKPVSPSQNETVGAYLASISGKYIIAGVYDNLNATWLVGNPNLQLAPGEAMWLFTTASATLIPPI